MSQQTQVVHPRLGRGLLIATSNGGTVWEVLFESGVRFRLPANQFETKLPPAPRQAVPLRQPLLSSIPLDEAGLSSFHARQTIEALRMGIVPMSEVEALTIGLKVERTSLLRALSKTGSEGGDVIAVIGDYGYGKSHFVELAARTALSGGFLVASASLDLKEMPPSKPYEIYKGLINVLRYPNTDERGLGLLMRQALDNPEVLAQFWHETAEDGRICPVAEVLHRLQAAPTLDIHKSLIDWLSGVDKVPTGGKKLPKLYKTGENARLYVYLLLRLSRLAVLLGYKGLAVLIDESEHYSLLRPNMRERADSFFQAMIYGACSDNGDRISLDEIPQRDGAPYPLEFNQPSNLFFMFALTDSKDRMPVYKWLAEKQIIRLDESYIHDDIQTFMTILLRYHTAAYSYPFTEQRAGDYAHLVGEGTKALSQMLRQTHLNLRDIIRTSVHLCDLLYLYPDYSGVQAVSELKKDAKP